MELLQNNYYRVFPFPIGSLMKFGASIAFIHVCCQQKPHSKIITPGGVTTRKQE